jgi:hypothetical protein
MRVFHHERCHPGAFPIFQGLNNRMMLTVGIEQVIVHAGKVDLIECDGVRSRKRNPIIACDRFCHYLASRPLNNQRMKLPVHLAVPCFIRQDQVPLMENLVTFLKALAQ